jgi:hypothetical protein
MQSCSGHTKTLYRDTVNVDYSLSSLLWPLIFGCALNFNQFIGGSLLFLFQIFCDLKKGAERHSLQRDGHKSYWNVQEIKWNVDRSLLHSKRLRSILVRKTNPDFSKGKDAKCSLALVVQDAFVI